jgi:subtilisin family serine protease
MRAIRVAVVDSGWDRSIADARIDPGVGLIDDASADFSAAWSDDDRDRNGHGTACADIILQVAPAARIVPVRVFSSRLETSPGLLIAAIEWAVSQRIPVINLSLGTERADVLAASYVACDAARRAGTIIVAAAGANPGHSFPAIFDHVIGVAAAALADRFGILFRPDDALECAACGVQRARGLGGVERWFAGSSFATPVVSGVIANFLEQERGADLGDVRHMLACRAAEGAMRQSGV